MIDDLTIQKIKDAASIVDVIGDFYQLRKSGVEYECKCPFHEDRHMGSFKISPRKNYAKCFSCGWQGGPIDFLMEHERLSFVDALRWLGKKYSIEVEGSENFQVKPSIPRQQLPPLPMLVLPDWMWQIKFGLPDEHPFYLWLKSINWDGSQRARLYDMLTDYHIGTAKNGMVIFWQIDEAQRVRTGKMMKYKADGHRDKESPYNFDWVHSALYRDPRTGYSADKNDVKPCLFGLHLLDKYKKLQRQQVCIVESEKTALLMAIAYGNHPGQVWMACGGVENLNREKLKPIIEQKRDIILYPDRDAISRWNAKAENLHYDHVQVDIKPVTEWWRPEDGEKADIADVVIRMINASNYGRPKPIDDILPNHPNVKILIDRLNLNPVDNG
jgi:hypothetical protein